ncbi:EamA family transporter [Conexibacter arvalis]|uniref:Drug/metabolite transporter (DMT)-like permease n=1 Tax=Conexibacter arvalis TaxID=912552 RepID=A0A840I967_9ACTN|nr:EamA family transporter [Conexibacter arvalis]MBB4661406.1 drug/metabolite transporter (DMT)-like permease [Conexibacter arvalis]
MGVLLALCAAVGWGCSGFLGGLGARRVSAATVVVAGQGVGLALGLAAIPLLGADWPGAAVAGAAVAVGMANGLGLAALYHAYGHGEIARAAPLLAAAPLVPLAVGTLSGEAPRSLQLAGALVAIAGIVLVSAPAPGTAAPVAEARLRLLVVFATVTFGFVLLGMAEVSRHDPLIALVASRLGAAVALLLLAAAGAVGAIERPRGAALGLLMAMGAVDLVATGLYGLAARAELYSVAAVLASLFPVVTTGLSLALLGERLSRVQLAGVASTFAGGALVVAG